MSANILFFLQLLLPFINTHLVSEWGAASVKSVISSLRVGFVLEENYLFIHLKTEPDGEEPKVQCNLNP